MPAEGESRDRLSRALRACALEASFNEAPPPPPAEAIARLIRTVIDEHHDGDGLAVIWHMSNLHSSRMLMGIALAEIALREDLDIAKRELALIASAALWVMREQNEQRSLPGVDGIACTHGRSDESGLESRVRIPLDPAAGWAAMLDRGAQEEAFDDRCRDIASNARSGELRREELPAALRLASAPCSDRPPEPKLGARGSRNHFIRKGNIWDIRFDGVDIDPLVNVVGLEYLHRLIAQQGRPVRVADLEQSGHIASPGADEVLDAKAEKDIVDSARDLRSELDKAVRGNNYTEQDRIREELSKLEAIALSARAKGGKRRRLNPEVDKVRHRVGSALDSALERIRQKSIPLYEHLRGAIKARRGACPRYEPAQEIVWDIGRGAAESPPPSEKR